MNAIAPAQALTITRANIWDILAIRGLEHACFGRDAYDLLALLELLISPKMLRLKAVHNERLVGFVAGELNRREKHAWIVTLGVQPNCEGQGIGTRLLLDMEQLLAVSLVKLTVRKPCQTIETVLAQPLGTNSFQTTRLYIDLATKLPIRVQQFAFPDRRGQKPVLVEDYLYQNVRSNISLAEIDFDSRNPRYGY